MKLIIELECPECSCGMGLEGVYQGRDASPFLGLVCPHCGHEYLISLEELLAQFYEKVGS